MTEQRGSAPEQQSERNEQDQHPEQGFYGIITRNTLPVVIALFVAGLLLTYFQLSRNQDILVERTAVQHAQVYSHIIDRTRELYASEVVETARVSGLTVTHDYRDHENAIPLPITLSREIEHKLGPAETGTTAKVYSPLPFDWRETEGGLPDEFARDAWAAFQKDPTRSDFYRIEPMNGVDSLRYAIPQVMQKDCIHCHNTYDGSPKRDWKVNDVRGVLEISYPIEQAESLARNSIWETFGILSPMLLLALIMLGLTLHQHRSWNEALADRIRSQMKAKQELRISEARYRTVLETTPDFNMIIDVDGQIEFVNRRGEMFEAAEVGANILSQVNRRNADRLRATFDRALVSGELVSVEIETEGPEGTVFMTTRIRRLADSDDRLLVVSTDISEQKRLEQQARQAQRMQAVGRLAGGVAHDFNNLLTAIVSFGSFAMRRIDEDHPAQRDLEQVLAAAGRGERLTQQLLSFSRHHKTSTKVIDVNRTLKGVEEMLKRLLGADIKFESELGKQMKNVRVDSAALDQVVVNLALNARDAMPDGGVLRLATETVFMSDSGAQTVGLPQGGHFVRIVVEDNGTGMDAETMRQMFDPFFTTKPAGKGTGLGLSTCWGIVRQAGGEIDVASELGVGTTITVYLPGVDEAVTEDEDRSEQVAVGGSETILVAEDDDSVRELVVRALRDFGYRVLEAADGRDAADICEVSPPGSIDLLLTDVVMPRMSGTELTTVARRLHPGMRMLFMSGYTDDQVLGDGVRDVEFLQKPFTPEALAIRVREVLDAPRTQVSHA